MTEQAVRELTTSLVRALRRLGDMGDAETANRLAGAAYAGIRRDEPLAAQRLNGVMHYLTRLESVEPTNRRSDPMTADPRLDVRDEPPARRHALIFETFDALRPGDGFELVNDHDPKPLYYQFAAEHAGAFSWTYLEQGPVVWRVRIGRTGAAVASA
jgi:uncharacterized protein (DUF2249 family)